MCVQFFHMVNIDVPAGVGAPPLNTTSEHAGTDKVCQPCQMGNPQHPSTDPSEDSHTCSNNCLGIYMTTMSTRLDFSLWM